MLYKFDKPNSGDNIYHVNTFRDQLLFEILNKYIVATLFTCQNIKIASQVKVLLPKHCEYYR